MLLSPMTKALTPTEKTKKQCGNAKNATKAFGYTTIADRRLKGSDASHQTGVVKPITGSQPMQSKVQSFKHL